MTLSLEQGTALYRLLADTSRLRLLLLLEAHELTVAELTRITRLAQSRVSTHLARLQGAGLVQQRRAGAATFYAVQQPLAETAIGGVWTQLKDQLSDQQIRLDREHAAEVVRARKHSLSWAESVAGSMERYYSPGRTWEATARALSGLLEPGDVLDIACGDGVLAELLAGHARSITGVDISPTLIAAARRRLANHPHARFVEADMHELPLDENRFDLVFLMHALAYTHKPQALLGEATRVLRPGGRLVVAALNAHTHREAMQAYDHVNLGFTPAALRKMLEKTGLEVEHCAVSSREDRPPYFEVITTFAVKASG